MKEKKKKIRFLVDLTAANMTKFILELPSSSSGTYAHKHISRQHFLEDICIAKYFVRVHTHTHTICPPYHVSA